VLQKAQRASSYIVDLINTNLLLSGLKILVVGGSIPPLATKILPRAKGGKNRTRAIPPLATKNH
jgi:hypothetical protein